METHLSTNTTNCRRKDWCLFYFVLQLHKKEKILTQLEIENILDETINLSIISKLLNLNLITETQFYILKEKIKNFY